MNVDELFAAKEAYEKSLEVEGEEFVSKKEPDVGGFAKACSIIEDAIRFKMEHMLRDNLADPEARREVDMLWAAFTKVRDG